MKPGWFKFTCAHNGHNKFLLETFFTHCKTNTIITNHHIFRVVTSFSDPDNHQTKAGGVLFHRYWVLNHFTCVQLVMNKRTLGLTYRACGTWTLWIIFQNPNTYINVRYSNRFGASLPNAIIFHNFDLMQLIWDVPEWCMRNCLWRACHIYIYEINMILQEDERIFAGTLCNEQHSLVSFTILIQALHKDPTKLGRIYCKSCVACNKRQFSFNNMGYISSMSRMK